MSAITAINGLLGPDNDVGRALRGLRPRITPGRTKAFIAVGGVLAGAAFSGKDTGGLILGPNDPDFRDQNPDAPDPPTGSGGTGQPPAQIPTVPPRVTMPGTGPTGDYLGLPGSGPVPGPSVTPPIQPTTPHTPPPIRGGGIVPHASPMVN